MARKTNNLKMKYTLVLLDFDGTLMDTSPGIIKTILYSMNKLGIPVNKNTNLKTVVGPPLQYGFSSIMKLEKSLVPDAINIYRKRYLERGMYDACHYPGTFEFWII